MKKRDEKGSAARRYIGGGDVIPCDIYREKKKKIPRKIIAVIYRRLKNVQRRTSRKNPRDPPGVAFTKRTVRIYNPLVPNGTCALEKERVKRRIDQKRPLQGSNQQVVFAASDGYTRDI